MSDAKKAALSTVVVIVAVAVVMTVGSALAEVVGGSALVFGLLVFMRAVLSIAAGSGE
jgi:hypothetical protein